MSSCPVPPLVPVAALSLYVLRFALVVASCPDCAMLRPGSYCLSHVCLDCGGPAHLPGNVLSCG